MKKSFLILCVLVSWNTARGQQTLFNTEIRPGYFVKPSLQTGQIAGEQAGLLNLNAGLIINKQFAFGAMYSFTFNEFTPSTETDPNIYHDMQLAGATIEYIWKSDQLIHFTIPVTFGGGEIQADWKDDFNYDDNADDNFGEDSFFFVEPGVMMEINLLPFMRLNAGVTYRYIPGDVDYRGLAANDISGLTLSGGLKFGLF